MKKSNNIEQLVQEKFSGFEAEPGKAAWGNIKSQIQSAAPGPGTDASSVSNINTGVWAASGSKVLTAVVALGIGGLSIAGYFAFNSAAEQEKVKTEKPQAEKSQAPIEASSTELNQEEKSQEKNLADEVSTLETESSAAGQKGKVSLSTSAEESNQGTISSNQSDSKAEEKSAEIANSKDNQSQIEANVSSSEPPAVIVPSAETENSSSESVESITEEKNAAPANPVTPVSSNDTDYADTESKSEEIAEPVYTIPNIFTPNQDGTNDAFYIEIENIDQIEVKIVTKSGKLVHQWVGEYGFWDGEMPDGSLAPDDMYLVQVIVTKEGKLFPKQGFLSLKR